uniref:HSF-type DNA-binding domain-containing protein n=1 Tax=Takifugu rubripes TaxID=31033 RepID=A0A674NPW1_TAKRU
MEPGGLSTHFSNPYTFPAKLWFLVNTPEITAIIWNNIGNGILIDKALLETQVLSPTSNTLRGLSKFRGIKFLSFIRQLHHYGFRKVKPVRVTSNCVHHFFQPYFKKDHPELLSEVKRKVLLPILNFPFFLLQANTVLFCNVFKQH